MAQKVFVVEGRQFRTQSDYARAVHDKEIIDKLRKETDLQDKGQLEQLKADLKKGKYKFMTLLGQDFRDEVEERLKTAGTGKKQTAKKAHRPETRQGSGKNGAGSAKTASKAAAPEVDEAVMEELRKQDKRRKLVIALCSVAAAGCLGYFGVYSYFNYRTGSTYEALSDLREARASAASSAPAPAPTPQYTLDDAPEEPREVLEEFKILLNKNQKLIGWLKIDDTNIDYPVMQTTDNEYFLTHNINQQKDRNGALFLDKDCDVLAPSTNLIVYGHHMRSGNMFGTLDKYSSEEYYKEHPVIQFDSIYEKGTYEVMYVFRSRIYNEEDVVFKYYQFIDAMSQQEFDSNMQEMAAMSLYDTGVTASYGDRLLTLSTCDYYVDDGRFVVVAKRIN